MYELAEEKLQMTLAVSLHATNDEKRRELMPIANKYSMDELLEACRNYFDNTGRRITFESVSYTHLDVYKRQPWMSAF